MNGIGAALLTLWLPALKVIVQERASRFFVRHHPHVSTLCLPDITAREHISQAFPLHICILQTIEYWRWNEATRCVGLLLQHH